MKKAGAWFTYEGEQLGQGRENAKQFLSENPQLMVEIDERVREQLRPEVPPTLEREEIHPDDVPISLESWGFSPRFSGAASGIRHGRPTPTHAGTAHDHVDDIHRERRF